MTDKTKGPVALEAGNFEDIVVNSDRPVLVDFWAEWCGPCRMLGPVIEDLASDFGERATIAKVDIDREPELAARFGIRSIPTVVLFKGGNPQETFVGVRAKSDYASAVNAELA